MHPKNDKRTDAFGHRFFFMAAQNGGVGIFLLAFPEKPGNLITGSRLLYLLF